MQKYISYFLCMCFFLGMASGKFEPDMRVLIDEHEDFALVCMFVGAAIGCLFEMLVYFSCYAVRNFIDILVNLRQDRKK